MRQSIGMLIILIFLTGCAAETPLLSYTPMFTPEPTQTPIPPNTPTETSTPVPTSISICSDRASLVTDLTIPDGSLIPPGARFAKTWRLRNQGTCTWDSNYALAFHSGERMSSPVTIPLTQSVPPDSEVDLTVELVAPFITGTYKGYWMLRNANGAYFGIGPHSNKPFWVDIVAGEIPEASCNYHVTSVEWITSAMDVGAYSIDVSGHYALVAGHEGLAVIDIVDTATPTQVGFYPRHWGKVVDLIVIDDYAYVGAEFFSVIDISNPTAPTLAGEVFVGGQPQALEVAGSYAYILDLSEGLRVIDISNPQHPFEIGITEPLENALGLTIEANDAYIAVRETMGGQSIGCLKVFDLSNPTSPEEVGSWIAPGIGVKDVEMTGSHAIASVLVDAYDDDIVVLDVSDPGAPTLLSRYDKVQNVWDIEVAGACVFVIDQERGGIAVLDVSDPMALTETDFQEIDGFSNKLVVNGEFAFIADINQGFLIWRLVPSIQ